MKKFIYKTILFSIVIVSILLSVNYYGDSAKIFHTDYQKKIADIFFKNKNATNISNFDERILQKELISRLHTNPDISIIGSSRTMLINGTYFRDKKVINNFVSGATIQDVIAIYQIYNEKNKLPKKIILGVDPWFFNINNEQTRWKTLEKEYHTFSDKKTEIITSILNNKTKQLFSFSYFQASFKSLLKVIVKGSFEPKASNLIYNQNTSRLMDGSISYGKYYRELSEEQINNSAREFISGNLYSIEKFNEISPELFQEFENLCTSILKNDIELTFYLSPYHPIVCEKLKQDYQIVLDVENKVLQFAKEKNIKCLGSYNPIKAGVNSLDFYDGMHSNGNGVKKIMNVETNNNAFISLGNWEFN